MPQTEADWLDTGRFEMEPKTVAGHDVMTALASPAISGVDPSLVITVGGIPRDPVRREKLPTINKLYAQLSLNVADSGHYGLMYNQPGTGKSSGDFETITFGEHIKTLVELSDEVAAGLGINKIHLVGTSAGSYMAARAVEDIQERGLEIRSLVLQSPPAFPEAVEDVPYGPEFSELIRTPWEVSDSPVFKDIRRFARFGGKICLLYFQGDDPPIPGHIQTKYHDTIWELGQKGADVTSLSCNGVAHNFIKLNNNPASRRNAVDDASVYGTARILKDAIITE